MGLEISYALAQPSASLDNQQANHVPKTNQLIRLEVPDKRSYCPVQDQYNLAQQLDCLVQLPFAIRRYLHLASGGRWDSPISAMAELDHNDLNVRSGLHLYERLDEDERVALGGQFVYGNVLSSKSSRSDFV